MTLFRAENKGLESSATTLTAGQSYATGAKTALQISIPDSQVIRICEIGWSQDISTATSTLLSLQTADYATASTVTAHSTSTVKGLIDRDARSTSMVFTSTTNTGYGANAIASRSVLRNIESLYVPQVYVKQWPLGQWPIVGSGTGENFIQINVNTTATVNAICWIVWDEA